MATVGEVVGDIDDIAADVGKWWPTQVEVGVSMGDCAGHRIGLAKGVAGRCRRVGRADDSASTGGWAGCSIGSMKGGRFES